MSYDADVVVIGAGPVGLMLACELRLGGASVVVLDRRTDIDPTVKSQVLNTASMISLQRRGLLPDLLRIEELNVADLARMAEQRSPGTATAKAPPRTGHFAAIMLSRDLLDESDPDLAGHALPELFGLVRQQQLEALLAQRASGLGADIRRGVEMRDFHAGPDAVRVTTSQAAVTGRWLVGCDGGRSMVRSGLCIEFPGTSPQITAYQAILEMDGTEALTFGWHATDTGVYAYGPNPGRILVVEFDGSPADRDAPVTVAEVQAAIRRVTDAGITVTAIKTATRFTDNARQAATYRTGRVLLAGDAAHVHSPFGGQGLNLGLGDAMNLGWKLAASVRGWAPEGLLDSYTAERHPVGAWVLDWTRAQIALMRPDPHTRAVRNVVADLVRTVTGNTYFTKKITGLALRYDLPGGHPMIGASAPDLKVADGSTLAAKLQDGKALLVDQDGTLGEIADGYTDRLNVVTGTVAAQREPAGLLVRPDGFVAWAADTGTADLTTLRRALSTWLGEPAVTGVHCEQREIHRG
jgi:2-polyprenyl-6-methoxyphenol hydroxylase-like FAD-dependent oxidoreductase